MVAESGITIPAGKILAARLGKPGLRPLFRRGRVSQANDRRLSPLVKIQRAQLADLLAFARVRPLASAATQGSLSLG
jgi:hypothetical protein